MTGFNSKRAMANDKDALFEKFEIEQPAQEPAQERNFCSRCGKRTADLTDIHTCTPPQGEP